MTWTQNYNPLGNLYLSALVAALPVVVLLGSLAFFHVKAHVAALLGLGTALLVAFFVYHMPPQLAVAAALNGALFGILPIGWIVLNAIFLYDISVSTGEFENVKHTIAGLASDRRVQILLIGFSFGAFIEGASGFGTPVAICGAMLIGLGFKPLAAAGLALIGNTAPVAYGALGTPVTTLAKVTGLPVEKLSAMVGRQLPFFSLLVPFWLVAAMSGMKGMAEVWPACLVAGLFFAVPQFLVSNFIGPELVDIVSAGVSILAVYVLLKFWQPKKIWRFEGEAQADKATQTTVTTSEAWRAWMPWIVLSFSVFVWGFFKAELNKLSNPTWNLPWLHNLVLKAPPLVPKPTPESAIWALSWLSATGTGILVAAIISGLYLGLKPKQLLSIYGKTLNRVKYSLLTIVAMLALGFTTRYSGSDSTMGLAFASTGVLFPFFSALLGWLGVALTGSDTSSNVLFGNLQKVAAGQLGLSPILTAATNSSGGVMGKMIDAQSIVVAGVATGQVGEEGNILRYVFWHSLVLAALVGVLVMLQAYVFPGMIPK
ncbi:MAG TPA: L-lactate permease [Myxococcaceae bacterium]|nr:L-lactate permease [Myxococcaceae bacterium]